MTRRLSAMLLAVASLFGAGVVMAAPAQAYCNYDKVCLSEDAGWLGYTREDYYSRPKWSDVSYPGSIIPLYQFDGADSNVSSIENTDPDTPVSVYYNSGYAGPCFRVAKYGIVSNMASIKITSSKYANDNMNSHQFSNSCFGGLYNF